jgi:hypothetical protein
MPFGVVPGVAPVAVDFLYFEQQSFVDRLFDECLAGVAVASVEPSDVGHGSCFAVVDEFSEPVDLALFFGLGSVLSVEGEVPGVWVVVESFFGVVDVAAVCGEESWLGGAEWSSSAGSVPSPLVSVQMASGSSSSLLAPRDRCPACPVWWTTRSSVTRLGGFQTTRRRRGRRRCWSSRRVRGWRGVGRGGRG